MAPVCNSWLRFGDTSEIAQAHCRVSDIARITRATTWAVQSSNERSLNPGDSWSIFPIIHFSTYLFDFIFQKFAQQQSIFPDFLKPAMEHAFLPVTSPNKDLEPVTLHKTELVWAGFLQIGFLRLKAPWCASTSHWTGEAWAPHWRHHPSCEALHLTETSKSGSHPTVCEQGPENCDLTTKHGAAYRVLSSAASLWPS